MALKLHIRKPDGGFEPIRYYGVPYNDAPLRELISQNVSAINAEKNRATQAENKLTQDLTAEVNRAKEAEAGALKPLYEAMPNVKWNPATKLYDVWKEQGGISVTEEEMIAIYLNSIGNPMVGNDGMVFGKCKAFIARNEGFYGYYMRNIRFDSSICVLIAIGSHKNELQPLENPRLNMYVCETILNPLLITQNFAFNYTKLKNCVFQINKSAAFNVNLGKTSELSYSSIRSIPDNTIGTTYSNITTITVHSIPYSLLTGTATPEQYTATGHTKEEWMQIVTDSTAKGITFTKAL